MKAIALFLRGLFMGLCDVIPGISGGTIALITGIYERLITAISQSITFNKELLFWCIGKSSTKKLSRLWKDFDLKFLLLVIAGISTAILLGVQVITYLLTTYEVFTLAVLVGLIFSSAIYLWSSEVRTEKYVLLLLGIIIGGGVGFLSPLLVTSPSLWYVAVGGVLAISAMLLPGVSGSFVLLLLGLYDYILHAVHSLDILVIGVFIVGILFGVFAVVKGISWLFQKHRQSALQLLIGFVFGSLVVPFRRIVGAYAGESVLLIVLAMGVGVGVVFVLHVLETRV